MKKYFESSFWGSFLVKRLLCFYCFSAKYRFFEVAERSFLILSDSHSKERQQTSSLMNSLTSRRAPAVFIRSFGNSLFHNRRESPIKLFRTENNHASRSHAETRKKNVHSTKKKTTQFATFFPPILLDKFCCLSLFGVLELSRFTFAFLLSKIKSRGASSSSTLQYFW